MIAALIIAIAALGPVPPSGLVDVVVVPPACLAYDDQRTNPEALPVHELLRVFDQAGWAADLAGEACCVTWHESRWRPTTRSINTNRSVDYGLWQINSPWATHSYADVLADVGQFDRSRFWEPVYSSRFALAIYESSERNTGNGWLPWYGAAPCGLRPAVAPTPAPPPVQLPPGTPDDPTALDMTPIDLTEPPPVQLPPGTPDDPTALDMTPIDLTEPPPVQLPPGTPDDPTALDMTPIDLTEPPPVQLPPGTPDDPTALDMTPIDLTEPPPVQLPPGTPDDPTALDMTPIDLTETLPT